MPVNSSRLPEGMNIAGGIDLFFMETEYVGDIAITSMIHFHHTPIKHCATPLQRVSFINSAPTQQHPQQDRQLIIGHHCHNIQTQILNACWIRCLATHGISLFSWCSFSFIALYISPPTSDGHEMGTLGSNIRLALMFHIMRRVWSRVFVGDMRTLGMSQCFCILVLPLYPFLYYDIKVKWLYYSVILFIPVQHYREK